MRKAKIVGTLGPASDSEEALEALIRAGLNVARLNFSHGSHDHHAEVYARVRRAAARVGQPVAILQDLQGPKIRVGLMEGDGVELVEGSAFDLIADDVTGNAQRASISYKALADEVTVGEPILLDDGLLRLEVTGAEPGVVHTKVIVGGVLKNRKGVNLPQTQISQPSLTDKDREDLEFGLQLGVDYVALSFVRTAEDIRELKRCIPLSDTSPKIIAKIEKPQAVDNLHEILLEADGLMVARGDLGVELPPERVPVIQKEALHLARSMARITITATQMLDSMTHNPRPTRAEASDVANAIFDGTDAVMLSGETAVGDYPVESVRMMGRIVEEAEASAFAPSDPPTNMQSPTQRTSHSRAVARAAVVAAERLNTKALVCFTRSGRTARLVTANRPEVDVFAFTTTAQRYNMMALYWGVTPIQLDQYDTTRELIAAVEDRLRAEERAVNGDTLVFIMGYPVNRAASTNMMKIHIIGELDGVPRSAAFSGVLPE